MGSGHILFLGQMIDPGRVRGPERENFIRRERFSRRENEPLSRRGGKGFSDIGSVSFPAGGGQARPPAMTHQQGRPRLPICATIAGTKEQEDQPYARQHPKAAVPTSGFHDRNLDHLPVVPPQGYAGDGPERRVNGRPDQNARARARRAKKTKRCPRVAAQATAGNRGQRGRRGLGPGLERSTRRGSADPPSASRGCFRRRTGGTCHKFVWAALLEAELAYLSAVRRPASGAPVTG